MRIHLHPLHQLLQLDIPWIHFRIWIEGVWIRRILPRLIVVSVTNVERATRRLRISVDTNRLTELSTVRMRSNVPIVTEFMSVCQLWACIYWHTTLLMSVMFVENDSPDFGFYKDIFGLILEFARFHVLIVESPLLIGATWELICSPIQETSASNVTSVEGDLHCERIWIDIWKPVNNFFQSFLMLSSHSWF